MYRRTLVLRRFGDLSFGLGYFEDGAWIDHASPAAHDRMAAWSVAERQALDAIHAWFDCCSQPVAAIPIGEEPPIAASVPR